MQSRRVFVVASCLLVALIAGCGVTMPIHKSKPDEKSTASMVIKAGHIEEDAAQSYKGAKVMAEAEAAFAAENYERARKLFGKVADDTANPALVAEKARFHEAECRRLLKEYVDAVATYNKLLTDFQYGVYRERAVGQMFVIADFWLEDTRKQMDAEREKAEGKRTFVPWNFVHFHKSKPLFDQEGHALKALENVYFNDPTGPYAEEALYRAGYVHFNRGNFKEADQMLSQMIEVAERNPPKSPEAAKLRERAYELAILAKNNATGGPAYDGRKSAEALQMIQRAKMTQPELAASRGDFLDNQMKLIRQQQAQKEFETAEFYRRVGKAPAAWFYYELVRRRYQGTEFHDKAVARMKEIHTDLVAQQSQSEFAKVTRREWNRIVLGQETPQLAKDQSVPGVPGVPADLPHNTVTPVEHQKPVPEEFMPRR
jgi:outer membrane protein assembly factor BamD (BamD/ComL family)